MAIRRTAWERLGADLDPAHLAEMTTPIGLERVIEAAPDVLEGRVRGRLVVEIG
jgi:acrylyl-CoA reductase (NADPH)